MMTVNVICVTSTVCLCFVVMTVNVIWMTSTVPCIVCVFVCSVLSFHNIDEILISIYVFDLPSWCVSPFEHICSGALSITCFCYSEHFVTILPFVFLWKEGDQKVIGLTGKDWV